MSTVIVLIDTVDGTPTAGTELSIAAASAIGRPLGIASDDLEPAHHTRLEEWGLHSLVLVSQSSSAGGRNLDSCAIAAAAEIILNREHSLAVLAEPTTLLREVVGRLAGRRRNAVVTGISTIRVTSEGFSVTCTIDGGLRAADVTISAPEPILFIHPTATFVAPKRGSNLAIESLSLAGQAATRTVETASWGLSAAAGGPNIHAARLVVSGGRGLETPEGYAQLRLLATALGGALGASRAAVESGWAPHDALVGQTGATIAPEVYLAFGISGAPQHLAGIRSAQTIIAVNTDPQAPIMAQADLACVGDARRVIDELLERVTG